MDQTSPADRADICLYLIMTKPKQQASKTKER